VIATLLVLHAQSGDPRQCDVAAQCDWHQDQRPIEIVSPDGAKDCENLLEAVIGVLDSVSHS
jgi:hypothetical protein